MTLEKAIEILGDTVWDLIPEDSLDERNALNLAIEAAKAWKSSRDFSSIHHVPLLPGETKE